MADWAKTFIHVLVLLITAYHLIGCADKDHLNDALKKIKQDPQAYLNSPKANYTLNPSVKNILADHYLKHYYAPWDQKNILQRLEDIQQEYLKIFNLFTHDPGFGINTYPLSREFIEKLIKNANFTSFPNINKRGITVSDMSGRLLPTTLPSYDNSQKAGQGYPFDRFQQSFIPANTPVLVIQQTQDGAWYLVLTASYTGWVMSHAVAFSNPEFIKHWHTQQYIVPLQDNVIGTEVISKTPIKTRLGTIYPLKEITPNNYLAYIAGVDQNQNAILKTIALNKTLTTIFPQTLTAKNIAAVANALMGAPYDWGGMYGYRDCSATTMDIMATFGIWLPRDSSEQAHVGRFIDFNKLKAHTKEKLVLQKGIPFLTLIHLPGHIMLYIGEKNGQAYVLQNVWGLHTQNLFGQKGRAIIGKTVITPLNFGQAYSNVPQSFLDEATGMTLLVPDVNYSH